MRGSHSRRLALVAVVDLLARCVFAVNVSIPFAAPADSQPLSPTLVSFSIEQDRWPDWVGVDARNEYTFNALSNYAQLTGEPPDLRVGANSEDHTVWSPTEMLNEDVFPTPNSIESYPEATRIVVGDAYYRLSRWLPPGTHMVWGVNLGANNVTNAVNMARAITGAFSSPEINAAGVFLDRLEIGNEADLYTSNGLRKKGWGLSDYVREWTQSANAVAEAVGLTDRNASVTIQGAAFANQGFSPRKIYDLGILNTQTGMAISTISQHHYQAFFCKGGSFSLTSFMNKASIRSNLSIFDADIAATRARGLQYVLGETNSVACHGAPGVSNVAGAAVWAVDYILHAATKQISKAYFHHGVGYKYNFFQPIALNRSIITGAVLDSPEPPHIHPTYYAGLVINTFIGSTGVARVVELNISHPAVSGYAAFENGTLARAAFINLEAWLSADAGGARPFVHVAFDFTRNASTDANGTAVARRMVIQHADDVANLTWAGQSFETADALPVGDLAEESVDLEHGLHLHATEVVLVDFLQPTTVDPGPLEKPEVPSPGSSGPAVSANQAVDSPMNHSKAYIVAGVVAGAFGAGIAGIALLYVRRRFIAFQKEGNQEI